MASVRTKTVSKRKPVARRKTAKRSTANISKKKTAVKKTSQAYYVVDSKGRKTNLKIVATKK